MRVSLGTVEVDDETRKAIRRQLGKKGLASRNEVKEFYMNHLDDAPLGDDEDDEPAGAAADADDASDGGFDPRGGDQSAGPVQSDDESYGVDLPVSTYDSSGRPGEGLPDPRADRGDTV